MILTLLVKNKKVCERPHTIFDIDNTFDILYCITSEIKCQDFFSKKSKVFDTLLLK